MDSTTLFYIHDPMCSWCWAYAPVRDKLRASLPEGVQWKNLLGGLAPDNNEPMPDDMRFRIMGHWHTIREKLGTEFNFDFWTKNTPRRSTYPACRAVLAAAAQGAEDRMIDAIQRAYYLRAMNPSSNKTLITLAGELNLHRTRFAADLNSPDTRHALTMEIGQARAMGVSAFPSLVLTKGHQATRIPCDFEGEESALAAISRAKFS